jgi:hypothetical protein
MEKLFFYIPENEITDTASFLDAIKKRIIEKEKSLGHNIFLKGPDMGICIDVDQQDLNELKHENLLKIQISNQRYV